MTSIRERENCGASGVLNIDVPGDRVPDLQGVRIYRGSILPKFIRSLLFASTGNAGMTVGALSFPEMDFWSPGAVAHVWVDRKRRRRPISPIDARRMALQVMEATERRLQQARAEEAALLFHVFEDEVVSA